MVNENHITGLDMIPEGQAVYLHVGGQTTGAEDHVVYLAANRSGLRRAGYGLFCFDPLAGGPDSLGEDMPGPGADEDEIAACADRLAERFAPDRRAGPTGFAISAPDLAGPMAVEAAKRNISFAEFVGAVAVSALYGVTHPFVLGLFGQKRDKKGQP